MAHTCRRTVDCLTDSLADCAPSACRSRHSKTVQQEPDNGDAWANVAAVHLQNRAWAPAFAAAAEVL